jgi:hypothetical protein
MPSGIGIEWGTPAVVYAADVNLLGKKINIKKNTEAQLDARKEVGLGLNTEKN